MTYLTRPVFEFEVDWSAAPAKTFRYDLRELALGFGAEIFQPLQSQVVQGYRCNLLLNGAAAIAAVDDFFAALTGRLQGFWLPAPFEAVEIVTAEDATHFYIADQNLRATWADHPDIHLWFTRSGVGRPASIAAVAAATGGRERVTLTAALATPVTPADTGCRLHYVRLADDEERGEFVAEGVQQREVRVVELPTEYEAFETGQRPIFLYHFWCEEPVNTHWRYTSFAADVVAANARHVAAPITHGARSKAARLELESLEIETAYAAAHPFALFLPLPSSRPLHVELSQCSYADPATPELLFTGTVRTVKDEGEKLTAVCDSWTAVLARKLPRMMLQPECNYAAFEPPCGVERWKFETGGTVVSVAADAQPPAVVLQLRVGARQLDHWLTTDWFAGGFVEAGHGVGFQARAVLASTGDVPNSRVTLQLNAPLTVAVGAAVQLLPGCDGAAATCRTRFNNFANFGGFPNLPERNLSLQAIDASAAQGGKK